MILFPIVLCASLASMVLAAPVPMDTVNLRNSLEKRCGLLAALTCIYPKDDPRDGVELMGAGHGKGEEWNGGEVGGGFGAQGLKTGGSHTSKPLSSVSTPLLQAMHRKST